MTAVLQRRLSLALVVGFMVFGLATLRTISRGRAQMKASDVAFDAGRLDLAIRHARRSATLYVPGAEHVDAAYARLEAIAIGAERARRRELARAAWRATRAAAIESRHLWMPRRKEARRATAHLERLMGVEMPSLDRERAASSGVWALALGLSFALLAAGMGSAIRRGLTADGRPVASGLIWSGVLVVIGLACLGVAIVNA